MKYLVIQGSVAWLADGPLIIDNKSYWGLREIWDEQSSCLMRNGIIVVTTHDTSDSGNLLFSYPPLAGPQDLKILGSVSHAHDWMVSVRKADISG